MAGSFGQIKEYPRLENYFIVVSKKSVRDRTQSYWHFDATNLLFFSSTTR